MTVTANATATATASATATAIPITTGCHYLQLICNSFKLIPVKPGHKAGHQGILTGLYCAAVFIYFFLFKMLKGDAFCARPNSLW